MTDQPLNPPQPSTMRQPSDQAIIAAQKNMIDQTNDNRVVLMATIEEMRGDFERAVRSYESAIGGLLSLANDEDRAKMMRHLDVLNGKVPPDAPQDAEMSADDPDIG